MSCYIRLTCSRTSTQSAAQSTTSRLAQMTSSRPASRPNAQRRRIGGGRSPNMQSGGPGKVALQHATGVHVAVANMLGNQRSAIA